jgi:hypothetical protein
LVFAAIELYMCTIRINLPDKVPDGIQ